MDEGHPYYQKRRDVLLSQLLDITEESKPLAEVKDILDEIKMIRTVLEDQLSAIALDDTNLWLDDLKYDQLAFGEARDMIQRTIATFSTLKTRAEAVENSVRCANPRLPTRG